MFSSSIVPPDRKETKLGNSNQEVSPSAGKNNEVALLPCSWMEVCLFPVVWICLRSQCVICYDR